MGEAIAEVGAQEMLDAADAGDAATVERLLAANPELATVRGPDGVSVVLRARYHGHAWLAEQLADAVSDLDLFEAAALGRVDRVEEVVAAAPDAVSAESCRRLHRAAPGGVLRPARDAAVLLEAGAPPDVPAGNPSHVRPAALGRRRWPRRDRRPAARARRRPRRPPARRVTCRCTPQPRRGDEVSVRLLLEHGADRDVRTDDGRRPIDVAAGDGRVAELLAT